MSISAFTHTTPIRFALEIAEKKPDTVTLIGESKIQTNPDTDKTELHADVVVVGAKAHLNQQTLLNANVVCCKTFLSLGTIKCPNLQIQAEHIVLSNQVDVGKEFTCTAIKTLTFIGFDLQSLEKHLENTSFVFSQKYDDVQFVTPKTKHQMDYKDYYLQGIGPYRQLLGEWNEGLADATIQTMHEHLDRQDFLDAQQATTDVVLQMGLRSPLVPEPQTSLPKRPTV